MAVPEDTFEDLKQRFTSTAREKAVLQQKSKLLEEELAQARKREGTSTDLVQQLLERQRELNIMLNRANLMLNRAQEINSLLSLEFNDLIRALPAPKTPEWDKRVNRIADLFKRTGTPEHQGQSSAPRETVEGQDAEFSTLENADRRGALWQSQDVSATTPSQVPEPDDREVELSAEAIPVGPGPEPLSDIETEPEEEHAEPVVLGRRGYPLPPEEKEEEGNGHRAGAESGQLFPARLRRWMQKAEKS